MLDPPVATESWRVTSEDTNAQKTTQPVSNHSTTGGIQERSRLCMCSYQLVFGSSVRPPLSQQPQGHEIGDECGDREQAESGADVSEERGAVEAVSRAETLHHQADGKLLVEIANRTRTAHTTRELKHKGQKNEERTGQGEIQARVTSRCLHPPSVSVCLTSAV